MSNKFCHDTNNEYPTKIGEDFLDIRYRRDWFPNGSRKKSFFFCGPATKAYPPPSSLVVTYFFKSFKKKSKKMSPLSSRGGKALFAASLIKKPCS